MRTAQICVFVALLPACKHASGPSPDLATDELGVAQDAAVDDLSLGPPSLALTLDRDPATPTSPIVSITIRDGAGVGIAGLTPAVSATGAVPGPLVDLGGGHYRVALTPAAPSGEVPISVSAQVNGDALSAQATALVLPTIDAAWGQPEAVPGLVNTAGHEDGGVISPDGEWLFVSTYSPMDLIACIQSGSYASPACQTSLGPHAAPERPQMFGADRILSPTSLKNQCPKLCFTGAGGTDITAFALSPVASYGFHRQADGSFAEPFVFGFDADGCAAPYGTSMIAPPVGKNAEVVFAWDQPNGATGIDLYYAAMTLGQANVFGTYQCVASAASLSGFTPQKLMLSSLTGVQGNPQFFGGRLFFDDDISSPATMYVATASGALPGATFSATTAVPIGAPPDDRRQPFFDPPATFYYTLALTIVSAQLSGDATQAGSYSAVKTELAGESGATRVGAVTALGQQTVAHRANGDTELYFVYGALRSGGINLNIGRVKKR